MAQSERTNIQQNYLNPVTFRFVIHRLPYTEFFTQSCNIPGISAPAVESPTPFKNTSFSHDRLEYSDFTIQVRVDENMKNYNEIVDWMKGLAFPDEFDQYANLDASDGGLYSDATLMVMTNGKNPNISVIMKDIFPISLGDINMDTTSGDIDFVSVDITFHVNNMEIRSVS